ncbi:MAG: cytochrome ubiquinol oxidase subunit I [Rhodospirillaceae bacterium]
METMLPTLLSDPVLLARAQFAFTISFHIVFPAFTIGLASYLAMCELLWLVTRKPVFQTLYKFWLKIFAISFGMGVVSGLVLSYEFGTNWSGFVRATGNVLGPLLNYEVLTAFFLESSFLGVMLFAWNKVGDRLHFFATCMVALGTLISAFWILAANSWMHTPAGYSVENGIYSPADWFAVIFNPSFPYRFTHMVAGAYLTTAFVVIGTGAWYLLRAPFRPEGDREPARVMMSMGLWFILIVAPVQIFLGDLHGLEVRDFQPAKLAAMEGHWDTGGHAPLILFGIPDQQAETNHAEIAIPDGASLIVTHARDGVIKGLKDFPKEDRPPVAIVFFSFRVMVGLGFAMLALALAGLVLRRGERVYNARWFLHTAVVMAPAGFIAVLAGWFVAEVGRQPFLVYGLIRTADMASPVPAASIAATLALFIVVYGFVFGAGIYYIFKLIRRGPLAAAHGAASLAPQRPMAAGEG